MGRIALEPGQTKALKLVLSKAGLAYLEQAHGHVLKVSATAQIGADIRTTALTLKLA